MQQWAALRNHPIATRDHTSPRHTRREMLTSFPFPHPKTTCKYSQGIIASGLQVGGARGGFWIAPPHPVFHWDKNRNSTWPSFV